MGFFKKKNDEDKIYLDSLDYNQMRSEKFCLEVTDVFTVVGVGTVITGFVTSGMCFKGDSIIIQTANGELKTVVLDIDVKSVKRKANGAAYKGEEVGINVRGIAKEQVSPGDIVRLGF